MKTIYDFPLYYDILFGWDRNAEAAFYDRVFQRHGIGPDEPVLEVGCGTGQVARRLAGLGRRVTGMDLSPDMVAFFQDAAAGEGLDVDAVCADMTSFADPDWYAAAYNPMSSFRLLHSDEDAERHLSCIASTLRKGGIYVLDLELREHLDGPSVTTDEAWEMRRDGVTVTANDEFIFVDDGGNTLQLVWGIEGHLRRYTVDSLLDRVAAVDSLEVECWYPETSRGGDDGASIFDADSPVDSIDAGRVMLVLRKR